MHRRAFLKTSASALVPLYSRAAKGSGRPDEAAWKRLNDDVDGNLIALKSPFDSCIASPESSECTALFENLRNPYYIRDHPELTQTLGWIDAWTTKPSVYAVAARNAHHIAAAVHFARKHNLRLVIKGGGHSYQGTSNAPGSLLIWTRYMNDIQMHTTFVPQGCAASQTPQAAVTVGAGAIWMEAYDAVTTRGGRYVQGGGCTTVGVAGLIQSGGFGSFSKHYGLAAAGLLEAEVVTADGEVRTANACTNPDLFWALKGGGGGNFGVVSKLTLRSRELPEWGGGAIFSIKAASDEAYRALIRQFVGFYRDNLFNDHWGEQIHVNPANSLVISMVSCGLDTEQAKKVWQPFLDWVARSPGSYTLGKSFVLGSMPARHWWDVEWRKQHQQKVFVADPRTGAEANNVWWTGDAGQVGWVIYGFESLWLPASLLQDDGQARLANALFAGSRYRNVELHFNKGLAGAPADAVNDASNCATNPAVSSAFALAIIAGGQRPAYPGIRGHEPDAVAGRKSARDIRSAMDELRAIVPGSGSYVSESNFFESNWQRSYWGDNYSRLVAVKRKYDPSGLFNVYNGVGSETRNGHEFRTLPTA